MKKKFPIALRTASVMPTTRAQVAPLKTPKPAATTIDSEDQVQPAPGGHVELVHVSRPHDEELVLDDRREPRECVEAADEHHHHAGENHESDGPSHSLPVLPSLLRLLLKVAERWISHGDRATSSHRRD